MSHFALSCEGCGAPLEANWRDLVVVCPACGVHNLPGRPGGPAPLKRPDDGRPRLNLGGRTWALEGRLGVGDSAVVYRGRWVYRLGEAVVVKVLAAPADADLLRREWDTLRALHERPAQGGAHFLGRLPTPVAMGLVQSDRPRLTTVYGWKSGFVHTLTDVGRAYPQGVPGPVMVWVLKRLLELLGYVHRAGFVHGAVTPDHVLVHPRDHGALLIGWTAAQAQRGAPLPFVARPARWLSLYEGHSALSAALDLQMACRCARVVAGWELPGKERPAPIERALSRALCGEETDGWALADRLSAASIEAYGPAAYNPLPMPGWR